MKTATHGNKHGLDDLYILPDTQAENDTIFQFLKARKIWHFLNMADIVGHEWYGKFYIEIPFGESLLTDIDNMLKENNLDHEQFIQTRSDIPQDRLHSQQSQGL